MADNALFMIHNPWGCAQGDSNEMRKTADLLDKFRDSIVGVYAKKCGMNNDEIISAMNDETWMSAVEAQAFGFVDEISGQMKMAALSKFDFKALGFRNLPGQIKNELSCYSRKKNRRWIAISAPTRKVAINQIVTPLQMQG